MDNANTPEYLEKIKIQVIENLKRTAFAPSVQMTDVPRDPEGMNDEADAELDDADEDENPDARYTKRRWDKYVEKEGELSDSDDEDMNAANGVRKQPEAAKRRRDMSDFINSHAVADDPDPDDMASLNGDANEANSRTVSDGEPSGAAHEESEVDPLEGGRDDTPLSPGHPEDGDDVEMADEPDATGPAPVSADGPQEATPPDSPPAVAANPTVPAHVVEDTGNDAMDEGDTIDDPDLAKEAGRDEREHEDITAEKTTEVVERSQE